jgi:hypothetical protein
MTVEVEILPDGTIHPVHPETKLPEGRAILSWPEEHPALGLIMSEMSLAKDWLRPEEDEAWAHLQPAK